MIDFKVNEERCISCGKCVADCPAMCIVMEQGELPVIPDESKCIKCQHCLAVCPAGALSILGCDPDDSLNLQYELPTASSMEALIKGRRSIRKFKKQELHAATIQKLLKTSWHAPTGTNAQGVCFTATMTRAATQALREEIYAKVGKLLEGKAPEQDDMALMYLRMGYGAYTNHGVDVIMRDAPHLLVASAPKSIPLPKEDCIIAMTTFDLLAPTMGVGGCWNGMVKWCLVDFFPELAARLGIPGDHQIGYCMTFGKPAVQYHRTVQRDPGKMNLLESL